MMVLTFLPEIRPQAKIKNAAVELAARVTDEDHSAAPLILGRDV
jgi:hypothetical protein